MVFCVVGDPRFARDATLLQRVGEVLLPTASRQAHTLKRWLVGKDAFGLAEPQTATAIYEALAGDRFPAVQAALGSAPAEVEVAGEGSGQVAAAGAAGATDTASDGGGEGRRTHCGPLQCT